MPRRRPVSAEFIALRIGVKHALCEPAKQKIWPLLGYSLREKLAAA
jgi:hypothetical protein